MRSRSTPERADRRQASAAPDPTPTHAVRSVLRRNVWLVVLAILIGSVYLIGLSLLPLVLGAILAYLLHPIPDALEQRGIRRTPAVAVLVLAVSALFFAVFILLVPILLAKARDFLELLPQLYDKATGRFWPSVAPYVALFGLDETSIRQAVTTDIGQTLRGWVPILGHGAFAALNIIFLVALTPFVTFYLLRDWHLILRRAKDLVPRRSEATVILLAARIDRRLSGFIRGQTLICILQGAWHVIGYSVIGLEGAVLIGIAMGVSNYIPFIGNALVVLVALGVAAIQFDEIWPVVAVVGLYAFSQVIEDGVLYPAIIGDRIKLHPIWVIVVLLAASGLLGLTGALLAIPIACVLEVLIAHATTQYRQTSFYKEP